MATQTKVRITRNPYNGYEVWLWGNGELSRRSFDNSFDLASKLAGDCVDVPTMNAALDMFEALEWDEPVYPLFQPAEAVTDFNEIEEMEPNRIWDWFAATVRVGAVAAPWVVLVIGVRWLFGGWR